MERFSKKLMAALPATPLQVEMSLSPIVLRASPALDNDPDKVEENYSYSGCEAGPLQAASSIGLGESTRIRLVLQALGASQVSFIEIRKRH